MKRSAALGAVFALFVLGLAVGVLGTHLYYAHQLDHGKNRLPYLGPRYMAHLEHRLDLSPEQSHEIAAILEQSHREAESLKQEVRPRIHRLMDDAHRRIVEVLTPKQRREFESLPRHRLHRRFKEHHRHPDDRPPHRRPAGERGRGGAPEDPPAADPR